MALATFPYLMANLVLRLAGDGLVATVRRRCGSLRVGAVVAFVGLAVVVTAPTWPVAVLGFTAARRRGLGDRAAQLLRRRADRRRRPGRGWTR